MFLPAISIVGLSGSGKTTLLEKVIKELKRRGVRVNVLKHDAHGFEIDRPGKDSYRHKKAGAVAVCLSSPKRFALIRDVKRELTPEELIAGLLQNDADVVITEGYKTGSLPKIEVVRGAVSKRPACWKDPRLLAVATDVKIKGFKGPLFDIDDYKGVASFIQREIIRPHKGARIALRIDGKPVRLKPFLEEMLVESISGMVQGLKGCSNADEIEVRVRKR